jgi:hypothetical protein
VRSPKIAKFDENKKEGGRRNTSKVSFCIQCQQGSEANECLFQEPSTSIGITKKKNEMGGIEHRLDRRIRRNNPSFPTRSVHILRLQRVRRFPSFR